MNKLTFSALIIVSCICLFGCSTGGKDDNTYSMSVSFQQTGDNGFYVVVIDDESLDVSSGTVLFCCLDEEENLDVYISDTNLTVDGETVSQGDILTIRYVYHFLDMEGDTYRVMIHGISTAEK